VSVEGSGTLAAPSRYRHSNYKSLREHVIQLVSAIPEPASISLLLAALGALALVGHRRKDR